MRLDSDYRHAIRFPARVGHVAIAFGVALAVLLVQLVRLQVVQGRDFAGQSVKNSIRLLPLAAPRGIITDRHGIPLVDNRPAFVIDFIPGEAEDPHTSLMRLAQYTDLDVAATIATIDARRAAPFTLHRLKRDLALADILPIEERHMDLPGVLVSAEPQRRVIHGDLAAHVVGALGEIGEEQLIARADSGYRLGDWIGKSGVEMIAETTLRGSDGQLQVQVYADAPQSQVRLITSEGRTVVNRDIRGRQARTLNRVAPVSGDTVILTLDLAMQQAAYAALGDQRGAVVVLEAGTGAVRALVSKPSFDPNAFVRPALAAQRVAMLTDPAKPMWNRALKRQPPGSTIKILATYAALATGVATPTTHVFCPGYFQMGRRYHCWKKGGHGRLDLIQGLAYSCDTFFFTLGRDLGIDRLEETYRDFGLGARTGIDLPGEAAGLVPGRTWKAMQAHLQDRKWYAGETLNVVIGQGQITATPLQVAAMLAPFANGGYRVRPHVIDRAETADGTVLYRGGGRPERVHGWNGEAAEWVVDGLREAFRRRKPFYGTAWRAKLDHLDFIGKTGTAQVVKLVDADNRRKTEEMRFEHRDHAWFVGAVLDREPQLVIAVLVEHGGHASETSVPIVSDFFNAIYPQEAPHDAPSQQVAAVAVPRDGAA